jgi:DNA-binding NarL/FixJ family response regulator
MYGSRLISYRDWDTEAGNRVMNLRIILADDHRILREGLRSLVERQPGMTVCAEAEDGRTVVRLAEEKLPDLVIMDIAMPLLNGIEATRQILRKNEKVRVIALSMHSDRNFVLEMLKAGASGYILKDCAFEELTNAIYTVMGGKIYLSPRIAETVIKDYVALSPRAESIFTVLTPREREVLQLLAEGEKTREIAHRLKVSIKTVETYRQQIMDKLNIHNIADLTKYAVREGLTSLEH